MPHDIRLAGPWELTRDGNMWQRCQLPLVIDTTPDSQNFALRRKFHRPTGLDTNSVLMIVVSADSPLSAIRINDHTLPISSASESETSVDSLFDVTSCLDAFNLLQIRHAVSADSFPEHIEAVKLRIIEPGEV